MALTNGNELYFWGKHTSDSRNSATPKKVQVPNVIDIAATRGSCATAFRTTENKVYLWGFAYGNLMPKPVVTEFTSLTELFLSLDSPVMLKAMEMDLNNQPWMEKLKLTFDDKVTHGHFFRACRQSMDVIQSYCGYCRTRQISYSHSQWRGE